MTPTLVWCVVGVLASLLVMAGSRGQTAVHRLETLAVGLFGAAAGGDLVASLFAAADAPQGFRTSSLLLAATGAVTMLGLLVLLRRSVGPLKPHRLRRH
jgi:uncharacterized membrane protein YeaQ/YmgE (transglycosylase-associated protein family)